MNNDRCCYCGNVLAEGRGSSDCQNCDGTGGGESKGGGKEAILKNLEYRIGEARYEGRPYGQNFSFTQAQLDVLADVLNRPALTLVVVRKAIAALEWALAKVPKTGWKPEYEKAFVEEYNEAVRVLDILKGRK